MSPTRPVIVYNYPTLYLQTMPVMCGLFDLKQTSPELDNKHITSVLINLHNKDGVTGIDTTSVAILICTYVHHTWVWG